MKFTLLASLSVALLIGMNLLVAQDTAEPNGEVDLVAWNAAKSNWHVESGNQALRLGEIKSAYQAIQTAWNELPAFWKKDTSPAMSQFRIGAAVEASALFVGAGAPEEAIRALQEAAKLSQELRVPFSQGRTDNTFRNRASIHARLFAQTGEDPLQGSEIGYELWKQGKNYAALQEGGVWDQAAPLFGDDPSLLLASEGEGKMAVLDSNGRVIQELSVAIAKGSGPPKSRLTAILKHESAQPESAGRFLRQDPEIFFASTVSSPMAPTMVPPSSNTSQATRQEKVSSTTLAPTPQEKAASSTPWSIIVVLIVAALGLLWLLLKRRS